MKVHRTPKKHPHTYNRMGVTVSHAKRDVVEAVIIKAGVRQQVLMSYDQAYELNQQLTSFLGDYKPDDD